MFNIPGPWFVGLSSLTVCSAYGNVDDSIFWRADWPICFFCKTALWKGYGLWIKVSETVCVCKWACSCTSMNSFLCLAVCWDSLSHCVTSLTLTNVRLQWPRCMRMCQVQWLTFNRIICAVMTLWLLIYFGGPLMTHFRVPSYPCSQPWLLLSSTAVWPMASRFS